MTTKIILYSDLGAGSLLAGLQILVNEPSRVDGMHYKAHFVVVGRGDLSYKVDPIAIWYYVVLYCSLLFLLLLLSQICLSTRGI